MQELEKILEEIIKKCFCVEIREMGCYRNCDECEYNYKQGNGEEQKEALSTAIKVLKEVQQYREIGTVEEVEQNVRDLKRQIEHSEHLAEVLKSTKNLLEKRERLLADYCKIGTVEECAEAMESAWM